MRLILRLAWRDAWRHRGKTLIALVMILLPVAAITAADVLFQTQQLDTAEKRDRSLGTVAAARIDIQESPAVVTFQTANPDYGGGFGTSDPVTANPRVSLQQLMAGRPRVEVRQGGVRFRTHDGIAIASTYETDAGAALMSGVFRLSSGRWPTKPGEVVINGATSGMMSGGSLIARQTDGDVSLRVVGVAESASTRSTPILITAPGSLELMPSYPRLDQYYVGGPPVGFGLARQLNLAGMLVISRELIDHPELVHYPSGDQFTTHLQAPLAVAATVVAMVLLEVAFLAGPAFAVGARRQERSLALMATAGGMPRQAGRVIMAGALIVGAAAAAAGVIAGIGLAWALRPLLQDGFDRWLGHFDVHVIDLAAVAGLGILSALAAGLIPAIRIARTDVVRVLGGRRGDGRPSARLPVVGVLLLAAGVGTAVFAAGGALSAAGLRTYAFGLSAILSVVALPFLIPPVIALVARGGRWLPVSARFAVRDAARHRSRTVPAVAAVAATVAGAVALGIAVSSNDARGRANYTQIMPMGTGYVGGQGPGGSPAWADLTARVHAAMPDVRITRVLGTADAGVNIRPVDQRWMVVSGPAPLTQVASQVGPLASLHGTDLATANRVLAAGGVVLFTNGPTNSVAATVSGPAGVARVPTFRVHATAAYQSTVLSRGLVDRLRIPYATAGLFLDGAQISAAEESRLQQSLSAAAKPGYVQVERGYQPDQTGRVVQWILTLLAGVLMVGGAVTATVLSMADAEPDLATLAAVGAAGRTRRSVAAAYALMITLVGAMAGAVVGFIPGLAIAHPLSQSYDAAGQVTYAIAVPWAVIAVLVAALPVLVGALIWLVTRTRLPMVARLN